MAEIDLEDGAPAVGMASPIAPIALEMLDGVARLVRLIERPDDIAFMARLIHREIIYRLLRSAGGAALRRMVKLDGDGRRVGRAIAWLRRHFAEPMRIEALARRSNMGVSTLHRHFQAVTGMSPLQYQKHLRLHEARRHMLEEGLEVASAALKVGYESPTQFIREYRRLFGEPPMKHMKSLKKAGAAQSAL